MKQQKQNKTKQNLFILGSYHSKLVASLVLIVLLIVFVVLVVLLVLLVVLLVLLVIVLESILLDYYLPEAVINKRGLK